VCKLLRKKRLSAYEFKALEARLGGVLATLVWGCGALGVDVQIEGLDG
jgi:hypothetical protein